jgi:hypothetical protein
MRSRLRIASRSITKRFQRTRNAANASFSLYLAEAGVNRLASQLYGDVDAWRGMTAGLLQGFVQAVVAIGTINLRLATIKKYCALALESRVLSTIISFESASTP